MIHRREFIALLGGAAVAWPIAAKAQQPERIRRIGILMPYAEGDREYEMRIRAFRQELHRLGWIEGKNIHFDEHWTTDNMNLVRSNAATLVEANPDAIVATGGRVIPILMEMTRSVPIVVPGSGDPIGSGYVASLARPGGNVTGFSFFEISIVGKILERLKQIAPGTSRVAMIFNPDNPNTVLYRRSFEDFAGRIAIEPVTVPIHGLAEIGRTLATLAGGQNTVVFFPPDVTINALRREVIPLLAERRLPAIYSDPVFVKEGGLAFYGADRTDLFRRTAGYIDRIFRGEKPSDLLFQQPTKYLFAINLTAAKALGLEITPTLLALADEVIE